MHQQRFHADVVQAHRPGDAAVRGAVDAYAGKGAKVVAGKESGGRERIDRQTALTYIGRVRPAVALIQVAPWSVER